MNILRVTSEQLQVLTELALLLWPRHAFDELKEEFSELLTQGEAALFLATKDRKGIGFAHCQLRHDYVEGTESSPVGYLEGIFVREEYRNHGVARALVEACEDWAREQGCSEFASDCELTNTMSLKFHLSIGFEEANRNIHFCKKL
ncbi:MAG: GNAT family N-acetyltransferase [Lachnospiraceae bacterium]|nr:GNAT family N-acetyltransferase [Lachnospiraceae bacterium]